MRRDIRFTKGDTYALDVKFKDITGKIRLAYFTVKENWTDATPVLQKSLTQGIVEHDMRPYKEEQTYRLTISPEDTANLAENLSYFYDLQVVIDNVVKTVIEGYFVVTPSVTGRIDVKEQSFAMVSDEITFFLGTTLSAQGIEYESDPIAMLHIGDVTLLTTNAKVIVLAINEVNERKQDKIAPTLNTTDKTIVGAVNELKVAVDANEQGIEDAVKVAEQNRLTLESHASLIDDQSQLLIMNNDQLTRQDSQIEELYRFIGA